MDGRDGKWDELVGVDCVYCGNIFFLRDESGASQLHGESWFIEES